MICSTVEKILFIGSCSVNQSKKLSRNHEKLDYYWFVCVRSPFPHYIYTIDY